MMTQRTRDFGLIKAAGCPSSLVGGYFMTELLLVTSVSCLLGILFGLLADFMAANVVFGGYMLGNWWSALVVFFVFFGLALFFGLQPLLKVAKMSAIDALSLVSYYGLVVEGKHRALSHSALTWRLASRGIMRRISPIVRVVILLATVFVLLTVSVAGGLIAKDTTTAWINQASEDGPIVIAYKGMGEQYELLLSNFRGATEHGDFNYSDPKLALPNSVVAQIRGLSSVAAADFRLVLYETVKEVNNYTVIDGGNVVIGSDRVGTSLIIGLDPQIMSRNFSSKGRSLSNDGALEAVVGDSISQTLYYPDPSKRISVSDPLMERIQIRNFIFDIVGVAITPLNNAYVTYVPLEQLMGATGVSSPNMILVTIEASVDRGAAISDIQTAINLVDQDLEVIDLSSTINRNKLFLNSTWQTIMFVPLVTLVSAGMCFVGYIMLTLDERRQEFAVLRSVGAKPRIILRISAIESAIVLLSSLGVGLSFGVILTLMILMSNPLVTVMTLLTIVVWLGCALAAMFLCSLYPAVKLSKTPILDIP